MPLRSVRRHAVAALCLSVAASSADTIAAPGDALAGRVVANGGTTQSAGAGYTLAGTIAQPVAGTSSANAVTLHAGFLQPTDLARGDALFSNGFED